MSCRHLPDPQPELGCYIIREVHDSRPDGALVALTRAQEQEIAAAAAILAVQGFACRLLRMADEPLFAAQPQAYRHRVLPPRLPALSPEPGESPAHLALRMAGLLREN